MMEARYRVLGALLLLMAGGCNPYKVASQNVMDVYKQGRFDDAILVMDSEGLDRARQNHQDDLIWLLERGKALQDGGRWAESEKAFRQAEDLIDRSDERAEISVTAEMAAVAVNQTVFKYAGTQADRILLSTYRMINALAIDDLEEAMVHARRANDRQSQAMEKNAKELAKADSDYQKSISSKGARSGGGDSPANQVNWTHLEQTSRHHQMSQMASLKLESAYANYANPVPSFLSAICLRAGGDSDNARVDFTKVHNMMPANRFLTAELSPPVPDRLVYVLFESGLAPERIQTSLGLEPKVSGISGFSLPSLRFQACDIASLGVRGTGVFMKTERLASLDSIVAADFKNAIPAMVRRAIVSLVVKVGASTAAAAKNKLLGFMVGIIYQSVTNEADLRTWQTIGSEFQLARCQRPVDGVLHLAIVDRAGVERTTASVKVPDSRAVIILVRSVRADQMVCHVLRLDGKKRQTAINDK